MYKKILILGGTLFIGVFFIFNRQSNYVSCIMLFEESVAGLAYGGNVCVQGIPVGEVIRYEIYEPGLIAVYARVLKNINLNNAVAQLAFQGVTGQKIIDIYYEKSKSEAETQAMIMNYRRINTKISSLGAAYDLLNSLDQVSLSKTLINTVASIKLNMDNISDFTVGIKGIVDHLQPVVAHFSKEAKILFNTDNRQKVNEIIADGMPNLLESIKKIGPVLDHFIRILASFEKRPIGFLVYGSRKDNTQTSKRNNVAIPQNTSITVRSKDK